MHHRLLDSTPLEGSRNIFLFGPRGTGKTSWLKKKVPNGLYIDLLNQDTFFLLLQDPQLDFVSGRQEST